MKKNTSFENLKHIDIAAGGLREDEVRNQRTRFGANEVVEVSGNPWVELIQETLKDPMIWFLVGIGTIFLFVGDKTESFVLFSAILPLVFMDAILHRRTQASTNSLKSRLSSEVKVVREGKEILVASQDIVPGDLVVVSAGEYIPADGYFEQTQALQVDESALTGESLSIPKQAIPTDSSLLKIPGETKIEEYYLGYAGTRILTGKALLRVLFTGRRTAYGEIVESVASLPHERTPLQVSIAKLVQSLIIAASLLCLVLAAVRMYQGHGWLDALMSSATLAIAAIPEEFPIVFTFFLGVGVYRLAKRHALVRRAVSVENIGRVSCICTDKTGTITIGRLKLTHLDPVDGSSEHAILLTSAAASDPNGLDPVDQSIYEELRSRSLQSARRKQVFPFTEDRKREAAFATESNGETSCYVKGSPEIILEQSSISSEQKKRWLERTSHWASEGHKVLACAKRKLSPEELERNVEPQDGYDFYGLLAFEDPPRIEVASAMDYCAKNGIHVLMITGDHRDTAVAIAKDIRLGGTTPTSVSAQDEPEKFEETWLDQNPTFLLGLNVVARCTPLQKLNIVNALKRSGELVAVTGDGVNDVPALKAADIGIAMGLRGTRSAKEVASIVLADDNFSTIVNAIMEGRQLFSNLKSSFEYLLLIHIPLVLTAALIPLLGYPILYLPVHIVWLELIIHPTALFAFQQPTTEQSHRNNTASFFTKFDGWRITIIGLGLSAALTFVFVSGLSESSDEGHARAKAMLFLTFWSAMLVGTLSRFRTKSAIIVSIVTALSTVFLMQVPLFKHVLHVSPLHLWDYVSTLGILATFGMILALKNVLRRFFPNAR